MYLLIVLFTVHYHGPSTFIKQRNRRQSAPGPSAQREEFKFHIINSTLLRIYGLDKTMYGRTNTMFGHGKRLQA